MGTLPHSQTAIGACRAAKGCSALRIRNNYEAAREDCRERYQTAAAWRAIFVAAFAEWDCEHRIGEFLFGEHDTPDRLLIPEKLYGRQRELETLLASFDRVVKNGTRSWYWSPDIQVLASPPSSMSCTRCSFCRAACSHQASSISTSGHPLFHARASLSEPHSGLLAKSEAELNSWRETLREALGRSDC